MKGDRMKTRDKLTRMKGRLNRKKKAKTEK